MEKSCRRCKPKDSLRPLLDFFFWKQDILKENYQKALNKLTLFFLSNRVLCNVQDYEKQKESETSGQSLFRLQNKFRKIPLLGLYYLTKFDDVI